MPCIRATGAGGPLTDGSASRAAIGWRTAAELVGKGRIAAGGEIADPAAATTTADIPRTAGIVAAAIGVAAQAAAAAVATGGAIRTDRAEAVAAISANGRILGEIVVVQRHVAGGGDEQGAPQTRPAAAGESTRTTAAAFGERVGDRQVVDGDIAGINEQALIQAQAVDRIVITLDCECRALHQIDQIEIGTQRE